MPIPQSDESKDSMEDLEKNLYILLKEMRHKGRASIASSIRKTTEYSAAMARSIRTALARPGCEVRITTGTSAEAVFVFDTLMQGLESLGFLDDPRCRLAQVELTNGSCIIIGCEEKPNVSS